ncbi:MAG: M28 family peptidase [Solirubrobacterales bacterium]
MDGSAGTGPQVTARPSAEAGRSLDGALGLIEEIAAEPRRPCSEAELEASLRLRAWLEASGVEAHLEAFPSYPSFGAPYGLLLALATSPLLLAPRRRALRASLSVAAALGAWLEGDFRRISPGRLFERRTSRNLVAGIEPAGSARRTLCLMCHVDSSRSGLMFHPSVTPRLGGILRVVGAALGAGALAPVLERRRAGRAVLGWSRAILAAAGFLVAERELRGVDVPGANDNASGAAAVAVLGAELASSPAQETRVVLLITGSEEANVLGARAFLEAHDTRDWLFLNFDGVGAPASLHFLLREGGAAAQWEADQRLVAVAESVAARRPDLRLTGTTRSSGLPYDSTPVLARGGRALTLTVQNGSIPNYHWPTDTPDRIDPEVLGRALEAGREMIAAIDRGEADL